MGFKLRSALRITSCLVFAIVLGAVLPDLDHLIYGGRAWPHEYGTQIFFIGCILYWIGIHGLGVAYLRRRK